MKWVGGAASILALAEVDIAQQGHQLEYRMAMEGGTYVKGQQGKLKVGKILIHPGEINGFKVWPLNKRIIASHSDHQEIFLWDIDQ